MKRLYFILAVFFCLPAAAQISPDADWARFNRYASVNAGIMSRPVAVLMGDSITDGWDNADPDFFTDNGFVCRGISGQTSSQMLVRFRRDVVDLHPECVVILAGTNDIACNTGYIAPENIVGNIASMCEIAKVHKIKPVICSVTPSASFFWRRELDGVPGMIVALNEMLAAYAAENRIPYVDYHSLLKDENGGLPEEYSADGTHPTPACYKIMEQVLLKTVRKAAGRRR